MKFLGDVMTGTVFLGVVGAWVALVGCFVWLIVIAIYSVAKEPTDVSRDS